jgi:hypothetical protein
VGLVAAGPETALLRQGRRRRTHATEERRVLDLGYLKCTDTFCHGGGWLTALEVGTGTVWQANKAGEMREE